MPATTTDTSYLEQVRQYFAEELASVRTAGTFKDERYIHAPQGPEIDVEYPQNAPVRRVINLCSNNYLGLSSHPEIVNAAAGALASRGYGMSSVRFICGTQDIHRRLEQRLTAFLGTEDTLLFPSCMYANAGVFEALFDQRDAIIADRLIHASLVDGIRLCKAVQDTYKHGDVGHLGQKLQEHADKRFRIVVTDGVFSMDGDVAPLEQIVQIARQHHALVCVDDSHGTGVIGKTGRGTPEYHGVLGQIDLLTTTLGKALGGASGGCVSGRTELVAMCRQRARPYLFSNAVAPAIVAGAMAALDILERNNERLEALRQNALYWRNLLTSAGFDVKKGDSPIVPVMLYNAALARDFARDLFAEGVYVVGFSFPVVPKGQARIRTQLSAAHTREHLDRSYEAFTRIGRKYEILGKNREEIVSAYGL